MTDKTRRPGETLRPLIETEKPQPIMLFLLLNDIRELGNEVIPGLSPCWDHVIHVVQSRNISLDPKDVKVQLVKKKMSKISFKKSRRKKSIKIILRYFYYFCQMFVFFWIVIGLSKT